MVMVILWISIGILGIILKWNDLMYTRKGMPPGVMGLPFIGETSSFLKQGHSFMRNKSAKYGDMFKSHILGRPTVICMDPEVNRYILMNEREEGLIPGYPSSLRRVLGKWNIAQVHGELHKALRGALFAMISPNAMRGGMVERMDRLVRDQVKGWGAKVVDVQEATKEMVYINAMTQIFGSEDEMMIHAFKPEFERIIAGAISLPIDLPGTKYHAALLAREKVITMIKKIIKTRRADPDEKKEEDMLDTLLGFGCDNPRTQFTDDQIIDLIVIMLFSGFETVSTTTMMTIKYLHDNPKALEEIRREHTEIRKRKCADDVLDWNDYKMMDFTRAVIYESMRLATIVNGEMRVATRDVKLKGHVIPKGWTIYLYSRETNYDPAIYPKPLEFNPWRWMERSLESQQHFLQFGAGNRLCPGKDFGIVQIAIFLHYFTSDYRWEEVGGELLSFPRVEAPRGLHMRIIRNQM